MKPSKLTLFIVLFMAGLTILETDACSPEHHQSTTNIETINIQEDTTMYEDESSEAFKGEVWSDSTDAEKY